MVQRPGYRNLSRIMENLIYIKPTSLPSPLLHRRRITNYSLGGIEIQSLATDTSNTTDICWHGHRGRGTHLHVWWECNHVSHFWKQIFEVYKDMYDDSLIPSPKRWSFYLSYLIHLKIK